MDLSKISDELVADTKEVAEVCKTYLEQLEYTNFSGSHPYETELIIKHIKSIGHLKDKFTIKFDVGFAVAQGTEIEDYVINIFKFYESVKDAYLKLRYIYGVYEKYQTEMPQHSSSSSSSSSSGASYSRVLLETYIKLTTKWEALRTYSESLAFENELTITIGTAMGYATHEQHLQILQKIKKIYDASSGLSIIDLYSMCLQRIFEDTSRENAPLIKYVTELVEQLKDELLPSISRITNNRKATLQLLMQRYRLIPDGPCRPFTTLVSDLCNVKIKSPDDLKKVAKLISNKTRHYAFIVISKRIPRPIENNIWLLTDAQYLQKNKLLMPPGTGICDAVLKRSQTIAPPVTDDHADFSPLADGIYYYGELSASNNDVATDSNFYYVLETLDGVTFRILYPWYTSIFAKPMYEIPVRILPDFTDKSAIPSTRMECYNEKLCEELVKHLHKPFIGLEMVSKLEKKQVEIGWSIIRKRIARQMLEDYQVLFDRNKVTMDNVFTLVLHPDIFSNALTHIIQTISDVAKPYGFENPSVEIYMSALKSLNSLRAGMSRDVSAFFEAERPKLEKSFSVIKVLDVLEGVLLQMLEKNISEKSNIYEIIQQKLNLLIALV